MMYNACNIPACKATQDDLEGAYMGETHYTGVVTWLKKRRDGCRWGGVEKTPHVDRFTFCAPTEYGEDAYSICLEWDEQPADPDSPVKVEIFALVRWAPPDLIQKGKVLILYQGADAVAEVRVDN
jgi:hypothetical protein